MGKNTKLPKILSKDEIQKFMQSFNHYTPTGLRNRTAVELMYRAGLRVSEVCNLSPHDINFEQGYVYVQQGKGKKDRFIPLDKRTLVWCKKWMAKRPDSIYFFPTLEGGKLSDRYLRAVCERKSIKAGVYINDNHRQKPLHPHTLRHCYGTELIEEGFNIREVQELLGHENIQTTIIYTHIRPEVLANKIRQRGE